MIVCPPTSDCFKLTESGKVCSHGSTVAVTNVILTSILIGTDKTNDPQITAYNGEDANGQEIVPTNTYDASALGMNGFILYYGKRCPSGIYVAISITAGDVEVVVDYCPFGRVQ